ncbi:alpha/beta fold hydrolase [Quadrisphaera granulorum]|nr:alpha/beta fold hydrolase [Quadrisphaera granulorum]
MHGGHMRAGIALGEAPLRAAGHQLLIPSRPGYGRTPTSAGPTPERFADTTAELCAHLGISSVRAVLGISAGGPAAVALAERHPSLVRSLLLISARSALPFPTGATRLAAHLAFGAHVEPWTWTSVRALLRRYPSLGLRMMLSSLSTSPAHRVMADLSPGEQDELVRLFAAMRSGQGFSIDVRHRLAPDLGRAVQQPALVIASRHDGQVDWRHAEHLHQNICGSLLWPSPSLSHLVWYGSGGDATQRRIEDFLSGL